MGRKRNGEEEIEGERNSGKIEMDREMKRKKEKWREK